MSLTTYLAGLEATDVSVDSLFPSKPKPTHGRILGHEICRSCPQYKNNTHENHQSSGCVKLPKTLPAVNMLQLDTLAIARYTLVRLFADAKRMIGSEPDFDYNAGNGNMADAVVWKILEISGGSVKCCRPDATDCRKVGLAANMPENQGVTWAVDRCEFPSPSACSIMPEITKARYANDGSYVWFDTDATDLSAATTSADEGNLSPAYFSMLTWRQSRDPARRTPVFAFSPFKGRKRKLTFTTIGDGQLTLCQTAIARPHGNYTDVMDEARDATMIVKLVRPGGTVDVSASCYSDSRRVYSIPIALNKYKTVLCLGKASPDDEHTFDVSLLDGTETSVEVTFFSQVTGGSKCAMGSFKCVWAWEDPSRGEPGTTVGVATGADGKRYACGRRAWTEKIVNEEPTPPTYIDHIASARARFQPDCRNYDCSDYAAQDDAGDSERWFTIERHLAAWLEEVWSAVNIRFIKNNPGDSEELPHIERVLCESIIAMFGGYNLTSPVGAHPLTTFPDFGVGYVGHVSTVTDGDGNEDFQCVTGAVWNASHDISSIDIDDVNTWPAPGAIAEIVTDWFAAKKNPFGDDFDDANDYGGQTRRELYRNEGIRIAKDNGALFGRTAARHERLTASEPVIAVRIQLDVLDVWQDCGDALVKVYSVPIVKNGIEYDIEIRWKAIGAWKPEELVSTRQINTILDAESGNIVPIVLRNVLHTKTILVVVGEGDNFDQDTNYYAGGGCRVLDWQQSLFGYNDPGKSIGGTQDLEAMLDAAVMSGLGIPALDDRPLNVVRVNPFGGPQAIDWNNPSGGSGLSSPGDIVGHGGVAVPGYGTGIEWGRRMDVVRVHDETGDIIANRDVLAGASIEFHRSLSVAHGTIAPKWTPYREDSYALLGTDALNWVASGATWIKAVKTDEIRVSGVSEMCVQTMMRRVRHDATPSAEHINFVLRTLNA